MKEKKLIINNYSSMIVILSLGVLYAVFAIYSVFFTKEINFTDIILKLVLIFIALYISINHKSKFIIDNNTLKIKIYGSHIIYTYNIKDIDSITTSFNKIQIKLKDKEKIHKIYYLSKKDISRIKKFFELNIPNSIKLA
jgi:hypothetical protein